MEVMQSIRIVYWEMRGSPLIMLLNETRTI